jgi:hypothetical protein
MYASSHVCDLCGQKVTEETNLDTDDKFAKITFQGFVRTHRLNAFTHELMACAKDGGYLHESKKGNGQRGMVCPTCGKYRDRTGDNVWKKPPRKVSNEEAVPCR